MKLYPDLKQYLTERIGEFQSIPKDRKTELNKVVQYAQGRGDKSEPARLTFLCTHNSRRSHLSQIWAHVAVEYYRVKAIETYSGGTEATAFNPRAIAAMRRCGLQISTSETDALNPRYEVRTSDEATPQICFSKIYNAPPNPTKGYCAIMTCSQADEACPLVMGCDLRLPIRYDDPKVADDSEQESMLYDERCRQICREMLFMAHLL